MLPQHKSLLDYFPPIFQEIQEFREIAGTEQKEADALWAEFSAAQDDASILSATPEGLARYEKSLGIIPKSTSTLEERRFVLLARCNEQLPYTIRVLERTLSNLCGEDGYTITVDRAVKTVKVLVALTAKANYNEVSALLDRMIPCNMVITLSLKYNQYHFLENRTHTQLGTKSHYDIRNEVLPS